MERNHFDVESKENPNDQYSGLYNVVILKPDNEHIRVTTFGGVWGREEAYKLARKLNENEEEVFRKRG